MGFEFGTRCGHGFHNLGKDVFACLLGLSECLFKDFVGETVALDVHLSGGETLGSTGGLEVHVAEVVFVAEDVAQNGIFVFTGVLDESHGDAADGSFDGHTGIHECERSGADGSHGGRTVAFKDVADNTNGVGIVCGNLTLEGAPSEVTVTDFTTANATLCFGFAGGEGREVVVKEEAHVALVQHVVHHLFVEFGAEGGSGERLSFAASEDGRTVRHGERRNFAPDGANVGGATTVKAFAFVKDATAHGIALHVVIVAVHESVLLFEFFSGHVGMSGGVGFFEVLANLGERLFTLMLVVVTGLSDGVGRSIALILHSLAEFFVVHLVVIFSLDVGAEFFGEFFLELTHGFDCLVCHFECFEECAFGHFVHFSFHHHDVFLGGTDHDVHVSLFELLEGGVHNVFSINSSDAHFGDGTFKGDVAGGESSGGCEAGKSVGHVHAIGGEERDVHIDFAMIVRGKQGAQGTVHETGGEDFVVTGATFTFGEATGEASGCAVFFFVVTLQGHEVCAGLCGLGGTNGGEQHRVVETKHDGSVSLLCQFSGFNADDAAIGQRNAFCNYIHLFSCNVYLLKPLEIAQK